MPGHPRQHPTLSKHVHLTLQTIERIDTWAALQGMNFSAALETLAQLGLKDAPPDAYIAPLEAAVVGALQAEMRRLTALLASSAIDSHAAMLLALAAAKRELADAEQYQGLKQAVRLTSRDVVRQRISRQGMVDTAAVLAAQADESDS